MGRITILYESLAVRHKNAIADRLRVGQRLPNRSKSWEDRERQRRRRRFIIEQKATLEAVAKFLSRARALLFFISVSIKKCRTTSFGGRG